jgi:hypothetical protein
MAKRRAKTSNLLKPLTFDQAIKELGKSQHSVQGNSRIKGVGGYNTPESKIPNSPKKNPIHSKVKPRKYT